MQRRLYAVTLLVPDYDAALSFYVARLGFICLEDRVINSQKRWIKIAPNRDATGLILAKATTEDQKAALGRQTGDRVGFFLETDNFETDYKWMRSNGIAFEEPPRTEPYGTVAVWRDPFGNRWDLIEFIR